MQVSDYKEKRRAASRLKEAAILAAAGACFVETGFKKTPVANIAVRAGVSKGLVFHLFDSKEKLFRSVVEDCLSRWSQFSEYRASDTVSSSEAELRELFIRSVEFVEEYPMMLIFMQEDAAILGDYTKQVVKKNKLWRKRITSTLKKGISTGEFHDDIDVKRMTILFHELQTVLIKRRLKNDILCPLDWKLIHMAADTIMRSIVSQAS